MNYEEMKQLAALAKIFLTYVDKSDNEEISESVENKDCLYADMCDLIGSYLNDSDEDYLETVEALKYKKEIIAEALRDIANDLAPECSCDECVIEDGPAPIDLLLAGEELELDDDELDEVIEELNDRFDSYIISSKDGKVSVKVK